MRFWSMSPGRLPSNLQPSTITVPLPFSGMGALRASAVICHRKRAVIPAAMAYRTTRVEHSHWGNFLPNRHQTDRKTRAKAGIIIPICTMPTVSGSRKYAAAARQRILENFRISVFGNVVGNTLHDQIQRYQIVAALQHDDIGKLAGGLYILLVHGLDGGKVLLHHAF